MKYLLLLGLAIALGCQTVPAQRSPKGTLLQTLPWPEAEKLLNKNAVVVIALGSAAKEHGYHLSLQNDFLIAEYLKGEVLKNDDVLVAPSLNQNYFPAFVEYPGTVSLTRETSRDVIVQICESYNRFGVRKFYVINAGISTLKPLGDAKEVLKKKNILLAYTNLDQALSSTIKRISKQAGGTHADEVETSMMLVMAPDTVHMDKAVLDYIPGDGPLTRLKDNKNGVYSPSGVWGDATLATKEKGRVLVDALVAFVHQDIKALRQLP